MKESTTATPGQPKKYKPEFAQQLIKYFTVEPYKTMATADGCNLNYLPNKFPTFARFSADIMVTQKTMHNWYNALHPEDYDGVDDEGKSLALTPVLPEWREAYDIAKGLQEANLTEGAMSGAYNPTFAGKAAVNLIQWRDKQEIELKAEIKADIQAITSEMTAEDAAIAYAKLVKGDDE